MKIIGMRIEKYIDYSGYSDFQEKEAELQLMDRYVLYAIDKYKTKYEIVLWNEEGECYSGYCGASWGWVKINKINQFGNITHTPIKELEIDDLKVEDENTNINNEVFSVDCDGGDYYYPCGGVSVNMELFKETNRKLDKRPVWLFIGESNIGKSYLAHKLDFNTMSIYETDSNEVLPDVIVENIIVKGNKYHFTTEEIESKIFGEHELIIVNFSKSIK